MTGKIRCAWCTKILGDAETELDSHGICPDCEKKVYTELAKMVFTGEARLVVK